MPAEDKFLAMRCRRMLSKKSCDMTLMDIAARGGVVHLSGELRQPRGFAAKMDLQHELAGILDIIRRMPAVKDVTCDVKILQ